MKINYQWKYMKKKDSRETYWQKKIKNSMQTTDNGRYNKTNGNRRKYKIKNNQKEYNKLRNLINREARKAREKRIEQECDEINTNLKNGNTERAFKYIRRQFSDRRKKLSDIKNHKGKILINGEEIQERWKHNILKNCMMNN